MSGGQEAGEPRPRVLIDKPDLGDLQMTIHGLHGIFWALDMLYVQGAADEIVKREERNSGIANLIVAGQQLAREVAARF